MKIVWDEPKRGYNLEKHGLDFATLDLEFFLDSKVVASHSGRFKAIGLLDGRALAVVFAPVGSQAIAVVSMRVASARERTIL